MKLISIVIPAYMEEKNVSRLYKRLEEVTGSIKNYRWEYIFVNDGSRDGTFMELAYLAKSDSKVKVIDFARNFGKEIALSAGVEASSGEAVITIDADLQHPPTLIPLMIEKWEQGFEVVATIRKETEQKTRLRQLASIIYYWLMAMISDVRMVSQTTDFRLIDKKVVEVFRTITERSRMYRGIIDWMGFKKEFLEFTADARTDGQPVYSYKQLFKLAINSITSFSLFPLKLAGFLGLIITIFSGFLFTVIAVSRFVLGSGYFSTISIVVVSNTFLAGITLICLGLIALYIGNIHNEVINRPMYIVRERLNFNDKEEKPLR
ncbi:MAG: glycosyltransferase family 2 protein [Candidatus Magnetoovum sp. WYHC-5]|nr:glycosyltransferase family 2 protein [Candidatus Magnetoovum sp. WYHC-5]